MRYAARLALGLAVVALGASACAAPLSSPRPEPRTGEPANFVRVSAGPQTAAFGQWIANFRPRARAAGISDATFDRAMSGIRYDPEIIRRDRNQSEFTKQIWEYLDSAVSDSRVNNGRRAAREHQSLLAAIEQRYRVEGEIVAAVWGLESAYGEVRGDEHVIQALATLAFDGRRGRFFESQLIAALRILQSGDTTPENMRGSWAGAMGHTQFIPTSYLAHAQDFDGDGRRDIWSENPADALASTAAYLRDAGWNYGQPWGMEVRLPSGFDYSQTGERVKKSVAQWMAAGVRTPGGGTIPEYGRASILLPAGARGAAFMIFDNFHVIERYNTADAYVIGVGHLGDRIAGRGPIVSGWPRDDRNLRFSEKQEMQRLLARAGYSTGGVDGVIGPNTIAAIRGYQRSVGMVPDGYASYEVLRRLR